jgi:hypothetical protein
MKQFCFLRQTLEYHLGEREPTNRKNKEEMVTTNLEAGTGLGPNYD